MFEQTELTYDVSEYCEDIFNEVVATQLAFDLRRRWLQ